MSMTPLFIVWGCWNLGGKIQMKLIWNCHKKQVTWKVWLIFVHLHLLYIYLHLSFMFYYKYQKEITNRDIQWCSSPKALALLLIDWAWVSWAWASWAWASSFEKTNKKNFRCFGPCPFLLLMRSLFTCWDDHSSVASLFIFMYFLFSSWSVKESLWKIVEWTRDLEGWIIPEWVVKSRHLEYALTRHSLSSKSENKANDKINVEFEKQEKKGWI